MMMDEELLISLVKERRELYDTQHKQYEDSHRREAAWQEISKTVQRPAHDCRERWKQLRDNYRKARKLRQTKKAQGIKKLKPIKYDKLMSFIWSIYPIKENNKSKDSEEYEKAGSSAVLERHVDQPMAHIDPLTMLESNYEAPKPDTIITFFKNLGETVNNFPEHVQIRVKRDIFKIINEAEEEVCRNKLKIKQVSDLDNMKYEIHDF